MERDTFKKPMIISCEVNIQNKQNVNGNRNEGIENIR